MQSPKNPKRPDLLLVPNFPMHLVRQAQQVRRRDGVLGGYQGAWHAHRRSFVRGGKSQATKGLIIYLQLNWWFCLKCPDKYIFKPIGWVRFFPQVEDDKFPTSTIGTNFDKLEAVERMDAKKVEDIKLDSASAKYTQDGTTYFICKFEHTCFSKKLFGWFVDCFFDTNQDLMESALPVNPKKHS